MHRILEFIHRRGQRFDSVANPGGDFPINWEVEDGVAQAFRPWAGALSVAHLPVARTVRMDGIREPEAYVDTCLAQSSDPGFAVADDERISHEGGTRVGPVDVKRGPAERRRDRLQFSDDHDARIHVRF